MYYSTKKYGHELGLSACFRQHGATHSHCCKLHGYALSFKFTFGAEELDSLNWVVDFGALKPLKEHLQKTFDHKLLIAADDPQIDELTYLEAIGVADVLVVEAVGCEAFAKMACDMAEEFIAGMGYGDRVLVIGCEVAEHGSNSAVYHVPMIRTHKDLT